MRDTSAGADAALAQSVVPYLCFIEMDFASGFVRACNSAVSVTWDSKVWRGMGRLGSIEPLKEGSDVKARDLVFTINAVESSNLALAQNEVYRNRAAKLWVAPLDADRAFTDVRLIYIGRMSTMQIIDSANPVVRVETINSLADLQRAKGFLYNGEDQRQLYPGDAGLDGVAGLATDKIIKWGQV